VELFPVNKFPGLENEMNAPPRNITPTMLHPARVPIWVANLAIIIIAVALLPIGRAFENNLLPDYLDLLLRIGIAIILAVSLNLINGITGQFSLGHAGFMAVGAYTGGILLKHYSPQGATLQPMFFGLIILGGLAAAAAGILVGAPTLRLRGDYLAIATLGFGEIITVILNQIESIGKFEVGGSAGLHGIPIVANFFWVYLWVLICVVVVARLVYSAKGKPFLAVREDEIAAAAMGVNTTFYKMAAFVIGAFFAGVAGVLSAARIGNLDPGEFNFVRSIEIVMAVVLGGSGSITGSILAAAVLTYLPDSDWLRDLQSWRLVIYALLLIVMMLLRPEGIFGSRELWPMRRRLAQPVGSGKN
jgi:branched-chain amino acid transport system permease protein